MTQPGPAQRPFEFDPAVHHQPIELVAEPDAAADEEAGQALDVTNAPDVREDALLVGQQAGREQRKKREGPEPSRRIHSSKQLLEGLPRKGSTPESARALATARL